MRDWVIDPERVRRTEGLATARELAAETVGDVGGVKAAIVAGGGRAMVE